MSYHIIEECASCGACEPECPNQAISEGNDIFVINPDLCTECVGSYDSSRCAEVCPVNALQPDSNHVETREQLLLKWQKLPPGETAKS